MAPRIMDPADRPRWEQRIAERTRTGAFRGELSFRRADGSTFPADVTSGTFTDRSGHAEGDRALRLVAAALRSACREADIVGRLSGDEFAILLAEATEVDGIEDRIRCRLAHAASAFPAPLSVSLGVAVSPADSYCDLPALIQRADQAMYADKTRTQLDAHRTPCAVSRLAALPGDRASGSPPRCR